MGTLKIQNIQLCDSISGGNCFRLSATCSNIFSPTPRPDRGVLLSDGGAIPTDGTSITIYVGDCDINGIQGVGAGLIGTLRTTTFLAIDLGSVYDMAANANSLSPISVTAALQAAQSGMKKVLYCIAFFYIEIGQYMQIAQNALWTSS